MNYISTRGNYEDLKSAEVIVMGMVPRGGLFVPEKIPSIEIESLKGLNYQQLAFTILSLYLTGSSKDYNDEEIKKFISEAYSAEKFDSSLIAPLKILKNQKSDNKISMLELWHGPTAAFKDLALQIMPYFLSTGAKKLKRDREIIILVATSGDTGKAALEGFKNISGTKIIVFYPKNGVSKVQELQMVTTAGNNTYTIGVNGNFDDCQTMVKNIFADIQFNSKLNQKGFDLSSANSINWGRLVPQIVYYFWAYLQMVDNNIVNSGDPVNVVVPTGNFGNILAAYYAKEMGLPVNTLICASNKNNILTEFINNGVYNKKREFFRTSSPSMDILISSNLERFLFEINGHNALKIVRWYEELSQKGKFKIDDSTRQRLKNTIYGNFASEEETLSQIKKTFDNYGYLIDPHTAVGMKVYEKYKEESTDRIPAFICATASPYKFNQAVYQAITGDLSHDDEIEISKKLNKISNLPIHRALSELKNMKTHYRKVIKTSQGIEIIEEILKI